MKIYKVRPIPDVLKADGSGTRRRTIKIGDIERTLTFGKEPVYLDVLPPEIAADARLKVTEIAPEEVPAGVTVVRLKPERVQEPAGLETVSPEGGGAAASHNLHGKPQARRARV